METLSNIGNVEKEPEENCKTEEDCVGDKILDRKLEGRGISKESKINTHCDDKEEESKSRDIF